MKELSIEEKAKRYDEILDGAKYYYESMASNTTDCVLEELIPELKENDNEQIRKYLIDVVNDYCKGREHDGCIAWLKKQGDTNKTINRNEFAQSVLRGAAINLITWIDYNTAKGNMCLSNMECKVIKDALVNGDWDSIYAYIKRKLEKQGKSNFEQSIQDGDNVVTNEDGTHFNVSQLERVAKKATDTKETSKEFLKSAKIMNESEELADEYRLEPKFKVGDWIISNDVHEDYRICKIIGIEEEKYSIESIYGYKFYDDFEDFDKKYHLWTIQDAKDGDVLATEDKNFTTSFVAIYKSLGDIVYDNITFNSHCLIGFDGNFYTGEEGHVIEGIYPATKEQRDLLFQKMKEAGYEWDAEKKELRKVKQKPTWSKEDEEMLEDIRFNYEFNKSGMTKGLIEQYNKWFEKIKSLKSQPKQEWSEEDEWRLKSVISRIKEFGDSSAFGLINNDIQWLKSLKGRVKPQNLTVEELDQAKKEAYNDALDKIEYHSGTPTFEDGWSAAIWYLKKRDILKSQSTWKPSDEQMKSLSLATQCVYAEEDIKNLESLYEQLKKL